MEETIQNIVKLFNRVFEQLGQKPLLDNPNFILSEELKFDHSLQFTSVDKRDRIKMMFEIGTDRITFYIDRTNEIPEWPIEDFLKRRGEIERELIELFSKTIEVEHKGNRTIIRLLDKNGNVHKQYKYYQGFSINWFKVRTFRKFNPYFEV